VSSSLRLPLLALSALLVGCGSLASSPRWVGGGLATTRPAQKQAEEQAAIAEAERIARQPKRVGAQHILVMHAGSQRKPEDVTRTREEARARAQECFQALKAGADFAELVRRYSDEPGAAERQGDLGVFDRTSMVKGFSDAAFALEIGAISEVVETPFGFHLIRRTE
jgi:parvulin-like peptidyl-prolyl isomerase